MLQLLDAEALHLWGRIIEFYIVVFLFTTERLLCTWNSLQKIQIFHQGAMNSTIYICTYVWLMENALIIEKQEFKVFEKYSLNSLACDIMQKIVLVCMEHTRRTYEIMNKLNQSIFPSYSSTFSLYWRQSPMKMCFNQRKIQCKYKIWDQML